MNGRLLGALVLLYRENDWNLSISEEKGVLLEILAISSDKMVW